MIDFNMLTTLSEAEIENPNLFPFPFGMHITFAIVGLLFFLFRFVTDKKPYQLIFAFAIPFSLTIWLSESRAWFYALGAIEGMLILCALITTFIFKDKPEEKPAEPARAEAAPAADDDEDDDEEEGFDEDVAEADEEADSDDDDDEEEE
ncbi:MAG: hypothetical protein IKP78_03445 [Ruminococcus sp.]|nr:hypothetical protein [Ruminococcus sp.]